MSPLYGSLHSDKTVAETRMDLRATFEKWSVTRWDSPHPTKIGGAEATVRFELNGQPMVLTCNRFDEYRINLRALWITLDDLRLAASRGILEQYQQFLAQLPAAGESSYQDPYEVVGVSEAMDIESIEAVYRVKAKRLHPDVGGDVEAFKRLQRAIETIREAKRPQGALR